MVFGRQDNGAVTSDGRGQKEALLSKSGSSGGGDDDDAEASLLGGGGGAAAGAAGGTATTHHADVATTINGSKSAATVTLDRDDGADGESTVARKEGDGRNDPEKGTRSSATLHTTKSLLGWTTWSFSEETLSDAHTKTTVLLFILCVTSGMIYGLNLSLGGVLDPIGEELHFNSTVDNEILNSATLAGGLVFSPLAGVLGDRLGRLWTTVLCAVVSIAAALVSAAATTYWFLTATRFVLGIGTTVICFIVPVYVAECAPASKRGLLVGAFQLAINVGFGLCYGVELILPWRWALGLGALPGIITLFLVVGWLPESPRFLLARMKATSARGTAKAGHKRALGAAGDKAPLLDDDDDDDNNNNNNNNADNVEASAGGPFGGKPRAQNRTGSVQGDEQQGHLTLREFWKLLSLKSVMLGTMLAILNNGIQAVVSYGPQVFKAAGYTTDDGSLAATIAGGVSVAVSLAAMPMIAKYSRRSILLVTSLMLSLGTLLFASAYQLVDVGPSRLALLIIGMFVIVSAFQAGPGPLFFVVSAEIFPQKIRAAAMGLMTLILSVFSLIITITFLTSLDDLGAAVTFLYYGMLFFACFLGLWKFLPETANVALEDIHV